jgi:hypothetical protein
MKTTIDGRGLVAESSSDDKFNVGVKSVFNANFLALGGGTINLYVNAASGNDSRDGTVQSAAFRTLDKALSVLGSGSFFQTANVYLASGSYTMSGSYNFGLGQVNLLGVRQTVATLTASTNGDDETIWDVTPSVPAGSLKGAISNIAGASNAIAFDNSTTQIQFMNEPPTLASPTRVTMTRPGVDIVLMNSVHCTKPGLPFKFKDVRLKAGGGNAHALEPKLGTWKFIGAEFVSVGVNAINIIASDSNVLFGLENTPEDWTGDDGENGVYFNSDSTSTFSFQRCHVQGVHIIGLNVNLNLAQGIADWRGLHFTSGSVAISNGLGNIDQCLNNFNFSIFDAGDPIFCNYNSSLTIDHSTIKNKNDSGIVVDHRSTVYLGQVDGGLNDGSGVHLRYNSAVFTFDETLITGTAGDIQIGNNDTTTSWDDIANNGLTTDGASTAPSFCFAGPV